MKNSQNMKSQNEFCSKKHQKIENFAIPLRLLGTLAGFIGLRPTRVFGVGFIRESIPTHPRFRPHSFMDCGRITIMGWVMGRDDELVKMFVMIDGAHGWD